MNVNTLVDHTVPYTPKGLARVGVRKKDHQCVVLQCDACDRVWSPRLGPKGRLRPTYWHCPNGCNHE
jgi:hypothetical protein